MASNTKKVAYSLP